MISAVFRRWMHTATMDEKTEAAHRANSSLAMFYQLSQGVRSASSELAARIEKGTGLRVSRADLSDVCHECHYYKECKKNASIRDKNQREV
jgi:hypothetical protein